MIMGIVNIDCLIIRLMVYLFIYWHWHWHGIAT